MTRSRVGTADGFALVPAIIVLFITMTAGLAFMQYGDVQQRQAGKSRIRESSLHLAEAALSAQAFQLARVWAGASTPYPTECTPASASTTPCPDPPGLAGGYDGTDYGASACPAGTPAVPWVTTVRDNGGGSQQYYDRAVVDLQPTADVSGATNGGPDGEVWVRATGVARCRVQTIVARVAQRTVPLPFPRNVVTANWFATNNSGNKIIVDTKGNASQPAAVSVRCTGLTDLECLNQRAGQLSPPLIAMRDTSAVKTATDAQMQGFRAQAQALGTYVPAGTCPGSATGALVFVEDATGCNWNPPGGNSAAAPGFLVIAKGGVTFGANSRFHGIVYAANLSNVAYPTPVIRLQGTASIYGALIADGPGGVVAGASKANIVYDPRGFDQIKAIAGAVVVKNSWRVLMAGQ